MLPLIVNKVFNEPWLIDPHTHRAIQETLINHIQGGESLKVGDAPVDDSKRKPYFIAGSTAIVTMKGMIGKHLSGLEMACGGCSIDHVMAQLRAAVNDSDVKNIMLHINSPGGRLPGVPEAGEEIRDLTAQKDIFAYTETLCASAGYWIASQCTKIICTPSSKLGSIGVYMALVDKTAKMEKDGVNLKIFEAGKHKAMGLRPLTDEEATMIQDSVDKTHEQFKAVVNIRRNIAADVMEGLVYNGEQSIENNLADALVLNMHEALEIIG
jgi:signal peptide peptidase SppA